MILNGLQKLTLLDYPGQIAATLFTGGCNLRCPFCHNASLVEHPEEGDIFTEEEILEFLKGRGKRLDGIALTGGEPLLQPDVAEFLKKVRDLGLKVKLDHNGTNPKKLRELIEAGLVDYVAVDIKNSPEKYAETVGIRNFNLAPIKETVSYLLTRPVDFEFRTTVVAEYHTVEDIARISEWIEGAPHYFLQSFKDSGNLIGENLHAHKEEILREMLETARRKVPSAELRGV